MSQRVTRTYADGHQEIIILHDGGDLLGRGDESVITTPPGPGDHGALDQYMLVDTKGEDMP